MELSKTVTLTDNLNQGHNIAIEKMSTVKKKKVIFSKNFFQLYSKITSEAPTITSNKLYPDNLNAGQSISFFAVFIEKLTIVKVKV